MRRPGLNLARRPFTNGRPVVRLALLGWLLGALFFAGNLWLYWDFLSGRGTAGARLAEVDQRLVAADQRIATVTTELTGYDLANQNEEIRYLNARIDERLFSWSKLFDRVARLMPPDARLMTLAPAKADRRQAQNVPEGTFMLRLTGQARTDEAVLEFVDRLYSDPAFDRPNLESESEDITGLLGFQLTVPYDPAALPLGPDRSASFTEELEK